MDHSAPRYGAPPGPGKGGAVTALGLLTLLWGGAQAVAGACLSLAGADLAGRMRDDAAAWGFAFFIRLIADFMVVVGLAVLLAGALGLVAGLGVLLRRRWGRVLAFVVAGLAVLGGVLMLSGYEGTVDTEIALGVAQLLYGLAAPVVLIARGAEFFGPHEPQPTGSGLGRGR